MFHVELKHSFSPGSSFRNRKNSGFTLVEVLVAMGVLLCFTVTICTLEILAFRNTHTLYHDVMADQVLGDLMQEARYTLDKIPPDKSGERVIDGITYKWTIKFNKISHYNIKDESKKENEQIDKKFREVKAECSWQDQMGNHKRFRHSMVTFSDMRETD